MVLIVQTLTGIQNMCVETNLALNCKMQKYGMLLFKKWPIQITKQQVSFTTCKRKTHS